MSEQREQSLVRAVGGTYFPLALVARMPYAMMVVGVLTLVVSGRGSLALGGLNSALVGIGAATCGPLLGAAVDRFGQRRVLLVISVASSATLAAMAWVVYSPLPDVAVLAVAFLVGATAPQIAPMSRSRLVAIISSCIAPGRRVRVLNSTMAYESAADEIVFIVGPVVAGVLAVTIDPWAPVVAAAALTLVFVAAFALHPSATTAQASAGRTPAAGSARELLRPGVVVIVVGILGVGLFFGSMLTSLTAFMADHGRPEQAGLVYAAMGVGSASLALGVALFPTGFTATARWLVFGGLMLAGALALPGVSSVTGMVVALLVIGLGIGPTLVTQYGLGARRSPVGRSATVMTMLGSGVILGQSLASALTGDIAERWGTQAALLMPAAAALVVVVAGAVNARIGEPPAPAASPVGSTRSEVESERAADPAAR
ncbi:MFS family permease [Nocardioides luteus]|uniref:MFS transporter n=1 Tax=Nocardioides luteus TaxID=1844 RepID=A0ABQ5SYK7_9ACTN|nr:MFS transporter [Nocardioides luteus]MDR7312682.1 MFS family permease [Nocardioides luteus]GGR46816.1 MFS transporter [Nocardioides luteus]GLJ68931.1 MFS transporter [Nocardioides luteus]